MLLNSFSHFVLAEKIWRGEYHRDRNSSRFSDFGTVKTKRIEKQSQTNRSQLDHYSRAFLHQDSSKKKQALISSTEVLFAFSSLFSLYWKNLFPGQKFSEEKEKKSMIWLLGRFWWRALVYKYIQTQTVHFVFISSQNRILHEDLLRNGSRDETQWEQLYVNNNSTYPITGAIILGR